MRSSLYACIPAIVSGVVCLTSQLKAQTLVNGDFESPALPESASVNWTYGTSRGYRAVYVEVNPGNPYITGWTVGGPGDVYYQREIPDRPADVAGGSTTSGKYYLNMYQWISAGNYRGTSVYQDIPDLQVGTNYFVFFDLFQATLSPNSILSVTVGNKTTKVLNSTFGVWQTHTIPFVATTNSMRLTFATPTPNDANIILDTVRVSTNNNAANTLTANLAIQVKVEGKVGTTYRVEYADDPGNPQWNYLNRVMLTNSPVSVFDQVSPKSMQRIYRTVEE